VFAALLYSERCRRKFGWKCIVGWANEREESWGFGGEGGKRVPWVKQLFGRGGEKALEKKKK